MEDPVRQKDQRVHDQNGVPDALRGAAVIAQQHRQRAAADAVKHLAQGVTGLVV